MLNCIIPNQFPLIKLQNIFLMYILCIFILSHHPQSAPMSLSTTATNALVTSSIHAYVPLHCCNKCTCELSLSRVSSPSLLSTLSYSLLFSLDQKPQPDRKLKLEKLPASFTLFRNLNFVQKFVCDNQIIDNFSLPLR